MQDALMFTLQDLLKSSWTDETSAAWKKVFRFIMEHMIYGLQSWSGLTQIMYVNIKLTATDWAVLVDSLD